MMTHDRDQMKKYADHSRHSLSLAVGDLVCLKLQPYKLQPLARKINENLGPHLKGPYQITKQISPVAFQLARPPERRLTLYSMFLY